MDKRTVLIAAHRPESAARLFAAAAGDSTVCLHARSALEARRLLEALPIDVLLVDGTLPDADVLARSAGERRPPPRVIVVPNPPLEDVRELVG